MILSPAARTPTGDLPDLFTNDRGDPNDRSDADRNAQAQSHSDYRAVPTKVHDSHGDWCRAMSDCRDHHSQNCTVRIQNEIRSSYHSRKKLITVAKSSPGDYGPARSSGPTLDLNTPN